ncbi:MAG: carbohydrate kinase family protein [Spirochaetaceae bacterium]|nr:MAG: carbohydrate kinase family protein [Spirochaetaceae bacterium]
MWEIIPPVLDHTANPRDYTGMKTSIAGVGCSLMDYLFTDISLKGDAFQRYRSRRPGDGGLVPGGLVFAEDLERFSGRDYQAVLEEITGGARAASSNLGGPSVVALVHAAQMLAERRIPVSFYGIRGDDEAGEQLAAILGRTPLAWDHYLPVPGSTPFTHVLSDPEYDNGAGERSFINSVGVVRDYGPGDIDDSFYSHGITVFGGTGLVPALHAELHVPVTRANRSGALTVVNTVYDFLNESRNPDKPWPLGKTEETCRATHLLIMDAEEARRLGGRDDLVEVVKAFREAGVAAVIVTRGPEPVLVEAGGGPFRDLPMSEFPISRKVGEDLAAGKRPRGDTTGCGDNFVGGVLASLAEQMEAGAASLDLREAISWGVAGGGFACFSVGGTYLESRVGEKREAITEYYRAYRSQIGR